MTRLFDFDAYRPSDPDEEAHLEAMRALARMPGATDRDHYEPGHFTASAFVLAPDGGALLLIEHAKLGRWLQPGGHVEPHDPDLEAAARREVAEETGLEELEAVGRSPFDLDVHRIPPWKGAPAHCHFDVRFLFRAPSLHLRAASDALAARWVPLEAIHTLHTDASVLRAVRKVVRRSG